MSNKDILPNLDFDIEGLSKEAVEIYNKIKDERHRKLKRVDKAVEQEAGHDHPTGG